MSMEIDGEEVVSPSIYDEDADGWKLTRETIHRLDALHFPAKARRVINALDRMHGRERLSLNVRETREELRELVEYHERQRPAKG